MYSTDEESFIEVKRPVILNGIGDFVERSDLRDRMIICDLPRIDDTRRVPELGTVRIHGSNLPLGTGEGANEVAPLLPQEQADQEVRRGGPSRTRTWDQAIMSHLL